VAVGKIIKIEEFRSGRLLGEHKYIYDERGLLDRVIGSNGIEMFVKRRENGDIQWTWQKTFFRQRIIPSDPQWDKFLSLLPRELKNQRNLIAGADVIYEHGQLRDSFYDAGQQLVAQLTPGILFCQGKFINELYSKPKGQSTLIPINIPK
jgi:hypothetical protein